ncbi:hypothetical protein IWW36_000337 [Coemansia brasiliensis]|uniref:SLC41A/MgtE integral membrane domain-containing protein n=1 Tax=Coemansia brasiliensis TaxID=2650707 RepID=A0A9W8IB75_9FUNG|nr:hypothetical protein IWW36_000337 [Coemansia brasiliensis]
MSQETPRTEASVIELEAVAPDNVKDTQTTTAGSDTLVSSSWSELLSPHQFTTSAHSTGLRSRSNSSVGRSSFSLLDSRRHSSSSNESTIDIPIEDSLSEFSLRAKTPGEIVKELTIEVMPALLISVAGSVSAGYILGQIQESTAFEKMPALFIMVAVLLNLKSNIELNMSTRLSTLANLGTFDNKADGIAALRSNMELLLLQSTIVGTCVGLISTVLGFSKWNMIVKEAGVLLSVGIGCSAIGSAVIGILIGITVVGGHHFGIDPDNIGTPIASSFGDMSTLLILGMVSSVLVAKISTPWPFVIVSLFIALGVFLLKVVRSNHQMAHHISGGWLPLVYAAITSSIAGIVVEKCAERFPGMPPLVPVVNGIGGNIGTVFTSRISTNLHRQRGRYVADEHNLVMLILLLINVPVQMGFLSMRQIFDPELQLSVGFLLVYTLATVVHGFALLLIGKYACKYLWSRGYDPDDYVNPFITGTGDMLGTLLLALAFVLVF